MRVLVNIVFAFLNRRNKTVCSRICTGVKLNWMVLCFLLFLHPVMDSFRAYFIPDVTVYSCIATGIVNFTDQPRRLITLCIENKGYAVARGPCL